MKTIVRWSAATVACALLACGRPPPSPESTEQPALVPAGNGPTSPLARLRNKDPVIDHGVAMIEEGRDIFRFDTFGSEHFWGDKVQLHLAIAGAKNGGVGPGLSPKDALALGLKVDMNAVPPQVVKALKNGRLDLTDPANTLALLQAGAVVGVQASFDAHGATTVGITCALCHSTVDDAFAPGIGNRLDGWPNRDLNIGAIVASAPNLKPFTDLLGVDAATVRKVLTSWGPGKYDAELNLDGKAFRPDGKPAATLIPAAFGLAGVNLHTYTGWGSIPYWNAYVATTQMMGQGTFYDPRLLDVERFPVVPRSGFDNLRRTPDLVTSKLGALQIYQLALAAPKPPEGSFDKVSAARGQQLFEGKAQCSTCHVPPLYTEPGWAMHTAEELGIDDFQAQRSPDHRYYRTTPLKGLFTRTKGGFYHDGQFADLDAVVRHYQSVRHLDLSNAERADLIEYLKSL